MAFQMDQKPSEESIVNKILVDAKQGLVVFDLTPNDVVRYTDLPKIIDKVFRELQKTEANVIKITGRGPVWLYSAVVHTASHLAKAVAVFDAVNKKYVIVVTHSPEYRVGDVLPQ
ncbi:MAG: CRISPR-associated protein Csx3 [Ignisphaera sp.]